jgi:DNA polymerase, archaea type
LFRTKRIDRKRNWFCFEGINKWIAFVNSKQNDILPVPNRYFGVYKNGAIKIRGIEARRHDTPVFFRKFSNKTQLDTIG